MRQLSLTGMTIAVAVLWGGGVAIVGMVNLAQPGYGFRFLEMIDSIYPWCANATGWKWILMASGCAVADGAIFGFLLAWIHNRFVPRG